MVKKLLSLPANLVNSFHDLKKTGRNEWFCASDPMDRQLGSGGGTTWLLDQSCADENPQGKICSHLKDEKRIILHAGGQSRRLPAYAPSGKILTPIPVFRWMTGQKLNQDLLSLQIPLYEEIIRQAPVNTLIASGDVYIRTNQTLKPIPEADIICYGLWVDPSLAKNHGVFLLDRNKPEKLDFMLQKPSLETLADLTYSHLFLMDIGIWLLSDKAVELLMNRSRSKDGDEVVYYDMYSDFGLALGDNPKIVDEGINQLSVRILALEGGEFYHYGTSRELISSTLAVQNLIHDQRMFVQKNIKPHPAMFVQNANVQIQLKSENSDLWIENSYIGTSWEISNRHIITGIPENDWHLNLPAGICVDIIPWKDDAYVGRPYGFDDFFRGEIGNSDTLFMNIPFREWMQQRNIDWKESCLDIENDLQSASVFPVCRSLDDLGTVLRWMVSEPHLEAGKKIWLNSERLSADMISAGANLKRLFTQRKKYRYSNWSALAKNYEKSVFYQLNLEQAAQEFVEGGLSMISELPDNTSRTIQMRDQMFRAKVLQLSGKDFCNEENRAFSLLREGILDITANKKQIPYCNVYADQIVWSRCPVRIDLAGGWTDTPPYCLDNGGNVVNMAIELNGQPPIQVYVKLCSQHKIILRSIDMGASEIISSYEELNSFDKVGSPFSIPKAALALSGFLPRFSGEQYESLEKQLYAFGGGLEITLLAAIPAGSGLGTSSILAATVLGALSDFCGMGWDKNEICNRTLMLEQLLTTGGGWQDQFGGVLNGVKLLQTSSGFEQSPVVRWLPDSLFTAPEYEQCHLLYYTGITRTAKNILAEIVKGMFLNKTEHLNLLAEMKIHALNMFDAIQCGDFERYGKLIRKTWQQNKALDPGTNPAEIQYITDRIEDYALGYKLPGAGGGGYLYVVAKDPEAAGRIRKLLSQSPLNKSARFVDMNLSDKGLQISRS